MDLQGTQPDLNSMYEYARRVTNQLDAQENINEHSDRLGHIDAQVTAHIEDELKNSNPNNGKLEHLFAIQEITTRCLNHIKTIPFEDKSTRRQFEILSRGLGNDFRLVRFLLENSTNQETLKRHIQLCNSSDKIVIPELFGTIFSEFKINELNPVMRISKLWSTCGSSDPVWHKFACKIPQSQLNTQITLKENVKNFLNHKVQLVITNQHLSSWGGWCQPCGGLLGNCTCLSSKIFDSNLILKLNSPCSLTQKVDKIKNYLDEWVLGDNKIVSILSEFDSTFDSLELVLSLGANPDTPSNTSHRGTPLFIAATHRLTKTMKKLLDYGANPLLTNAWNWTLYTAMEYEHSTEEIEEMKNYANHLRKV